MPFYQASTNSTTASADAMAFIETGLSAHAGWTQVDSGALISGTVTHIWKCLGSQNAYGQDFYLTLYRDTAGINTLGVRVSEGYNATTHNVIRPAPAGAASFGATVSSVDWSIGNGTEYSQNLSGATQGASFIVNVSCPVTVGNDHFMVVSKSFIAYGMNSSGVPNNGFYVGNFDPSYSSTYNPVMIVMASASVPNLGQATRFPNCATSPVYPSVSGGDVFLFPATFPDGYLTTLSIAEKFRGLTEATSVMITGASGYVGINGAGLFASGGGLRGSLPSSVMLMVAEGIAPRNGDFFTVGSSDYFRIGKNGAAGGYSNMVASPGGSFYIAKNATY